MIEVDSSLLEAKGREVWREGGAALLHEVGGFRGNGSKSRQKVVLETIWFSDTFFVAFRAPDGLHNGSKIRPKSSPWPETGDPRFCCYLLHFEHI